jgi:hypothetical protein
MARAKAQQRLTVKTYRGDAKTLLAFNLPDRASATNLAGFTIQCKPPQGDSFFLQNSFRFENPGVHAQDSSEPSTSTINAPLHKFRWLHIPGAFEGVKPVFGSYTYTVTPRFFDDSQSLISIDPNQSTSVNADVRPFATKGLTLGFTRGFTQSQAFVHHFGLKAPLQPPGSDLLFDTSAVAGRNSAGKSFTFADEYEWSGFTARQRIFEALDEVTSDRSLSLDVFAYDLNEPDLIGALLKLAKQGRIRVILDDSKEHHSDTKPAPEDEFATLFEQAATGGALVKRGKFGRFAHDKIFIISDGTQATKVMTGSTNFSVTGMYVNSNHVLIFDDPKVAGKYKDVFDAAFEGDVKAPAFLATPLSSEVFDATSKRTPKSEITFSPHKKAFAEGILQGIVDRINDETNSERGSVLFAVMDIGSGTGPVLPALRDLHANEAIFSYGISDSTKGIELFRPGKKTGVLVTGKPGKSQLPPPFDQVPVIGGFHHQVHHKFIVCGFNGDNPVVYCGSSNLAQGGEQQNGDNLIAIHDGGVATVFAIEALALVDHFHFLDKVARAQGSEPKSLVKLASKQQVAASAGAFLSTTDAWVNPYFDPDDLHFVDRELFG